MAKPSNKQPVDHWQRVMRSPLAGTYISELFWLARDSVETCERIFSDAPAPADATTSYIKVDHQLQGEIYRVLNNAARIRALVKSRPKRQEQSAAQFAIQEQRTKWLGEAVAGINLSEVLHAKVRNSLEHFDEYLDKTALKFSQATISGSALLPMDFTVGRDGTLDQFADGGTVYPLRVFLAEEKVFVNCGARVSLDVMARECQEIVNRLITLSPGLIEDQGNTTGQERGSSILVLTSRSFDEGSS